MPVIAGIILQNCEECGNGRHSATFKKPHRRTSGGVVAVVSAIRSMLRPRCGMTLSAASTCFELLQETPQEVIVGSRVYGYCDGSVSSSIRCGEMRAHARTVERVSWWLRGACGDLSHPQHNYPRFSSTSRYSRNGVPLIIPPPQDSRAMRLLSLLTLFALTAAVSMAQETSGAPAETGAVTGASQGPTDGASLGPAGDSSPAPATFNASDYGFTTNKFVIVGGGMIGTLAGLTLATLGQEVTIVEARKRLGGRFWTDRSITADAIHQSIYFEETYAVELGDFFIPLTDLDDSFRALLDGFGLTAGLISEPGMDFKDGVRVTTPSTTDVDILLKNLNALVANGRALVESDGADISVQAFLDKNAAETGTASFNSDIEFLEWLEGAPLDELSNKYGLLLGENDVRDTLYVTNGIGKLFDLVRFIVDFGIIPMKLVLDAPVAEIATTANESTVTLVNGTKFTSDYVMVTVPIGVLQAGSIKFTPALPETHTKAIAKLGVGVRNTAVASWPADVAFNFFTNLTFDDGTFPLSFDFDVASANAETRGMFNGFLNGIKLAGTPTLTSFATGKYGRKMETLTDASVQADFMANLKKVFPSAPEPTGFNVSRWGQEPYSKGWYSFAKVGATPADYTTLLTPFGGSETNARVAFAAEYATVGNSGTMRGAFDAATLTMVLALAPPDLSCENSILAVEAVCPKVAGPLLREKSDDFVNNPTATQTKDTCDCLAANQDLLYAVAFTCKADVTVRALNFNYLNCAVDADGKLCGPQVGAIKDATDSSLAVLKSPTSPPAKTMSQALLTKACNSTCLDPVLEGVGALVGILDALTSDDSVCDDKCQESLRGAQVRALQIFSGFYMCAPNDNTNDVKNPYCLPIVRANAIEASAKCEKTPVSQCAKQGVCFVSKDGKKCDPLSNYPIVKRLPYGNVSKQCDNNCFTIASFASAALAELAFALQNPEVNLTSSKGKVSGNRDPVKVTFELMTQGFTSSGLDQTGAFLDSVAEAMCVPGDKGKLCGEMLLPTAVAPEGCSDSEFKGFFSTAPSCPSATCKAALESAVAGAGCCAASWLAMLDNLDTTFATMPNYNGALKACGTTVPARCDPYAVTETVEIVISGVTCEWLAADPKNRDKVIKALADSRGESEAALSGLVFYDDNDQPCGSSNATTSSNTTARRQTKDAKKKGSKMKFDTKGSSKDSLDRKNAALKKQAGSDGLALPEVQKSTSTFTAKSNPNISKASSSANASKAAAASGTVLKRTSGASVAHVLLAIVAAVVAALLA